MWDTNHYATLKGKMCIQFVSTLHLVSYNYRQADVVVFMVVLSCLLTYFAVGGYYVNIILECHN